MIFYNDKEVISSKRHDNPKWVMLSNRASKYTKQNLTELKGERDKTTIIEYFNTSLQ